jgi:hypothetical protein
MAPVPGHIPSGCARGREEVGAAAHGERGLPQVVVDQVLRAPDHHHLGTGGEVGPVKHAKARLGHVPPQRVRADHERGPAAARLGQQVLQRAAHRDHVAHRCADADSP